MSSHYTKWEKRCVVLKVTMYCQESKIKDWQQYWKQKFWVHIGRRRESSLW